MDDNQKRDQNNNNKNKKNFNGLLILLAWATVLTIAFNYLCWKRALLAPLKEVCFMKDYTQSPDAGADGIIEGRNAVAEWRGPRC